MLLRLQALRDLVSDNTEIIVVDGGSEDNSLSIAQTVADQVIRSKPGRAIQMNAGAAVAQGSCLLFLHIDTQLPTNFNNDLSVMKQADWGFFTVVLSGKLWPLRIIESMMNIRSSLTAVATGDQCIFVGKQLFEQCNGYKIIPLMEDVELSKRLREIKKPQIVKNKVVTSSRRWETYGIIKTVILMWRLRWAFFRGVDPHLFAKRYYPKN